MMQQVHLNYSPAGPTQTKRKTMECQYEPPAHCRIQRIFSLIEIYSPPILIMLFYHGMRIQYV